jgi:hypothetical protein
VVDLSYRDIHGNLQEKQETANSYVISKPGEYCFPLIMGNGIKDGKTNYLAFTNQKLSNKQADFYDYLDRIITSPELIGGKSVSIISWDSSREFIKNLRVEGDYIKFLITNISEEGANYVVGVKDKNGDIMWSWHLWLWKNKLEDIKIKKYKFLNTNLATKGGRSWYYQWGRKDPICFLDKMVIVKECSETVGRSIQHPRTFYLSGDGTYNYNWVKKEFYYNYWNSRCNKEQVDEEVIKTIYDPCPPGYKVPRYSIFTNLKKDHWDNDRKGWVFNDGKIFFSAPGHRNYGTGSSYGISYLGYYWSAGASDKSNATPMYFYSDVVNQRGSSVRANGFSVRPMKEEK